MATLPLNQVVDVEYDITPTAAPRRGFNLGLIVGPSGVVSPSDRVIEYASLTEMIEDGFSTEMPEYKAAELYFGAASTPNKVAIGRQASGEDPLDAIMACRQANNEWYSAYMVDVADSDQLAVAGFIETATPYSTYFINSDDAAILANPSDNLFQDLKALKRRRTIGQYSSTEHAVASIMGYAMGQTSNLANSAYTLKFKSEPGVLTEALTSQQATNIFTNYGNAYLNYGNFYDIFTEGSVFSGEWFDRIIYLDKLANEIQLNVMDLLVAQPKVPQTEEGSASITTKINQASEILRSIGYIAPGQWRGPNILSLSNNDYLPDGYLVLSEPVIGQASADFNARVCPPKYVCINEAGAMHSLVIRINISQ